MIGSLRSAMLRSRVSATAAIRAQFGPDLPVVALTANAMSGDRERCLDAGMDDFLAKPVTVDALRRVLRRYLARRE